MTSPDKNSISSPARVSETLVQEPEMLVAEPQVDLEVRGQTTANAPRSAELASRNGETLVQSLLSIIIIVLFVITFIVQAFQIPSESMEQTLLIGDYLLVDKVHFGQGSLSDWLMPYTPLKRGDIVVFHYPVDPAQHFVKRVIGLPGDKICLRNKIVYVNGMPLAESYAVYVPQDRNLYRDNFPSDPGSTGEIDARWRSELGSHFRSGELVVPADRYFVMGDNRDHSLDSRYWGFVPRDNIVGRPLLVYLSLREREQSVADRGNGKLFNSGRLLTHVWQFARWDRMFHLIR
jgi:signal peptidase I